MFVLIMNSNTATCRNQQLQGSSLTKYEGKQNSNCLPSLPEYLAHFKGSVRRVILEF